MNEESWIQNKIKGDFAENICKAHFELIGYSVDSIGIENIAPQYCNNLRIDKNIALSNNLLKNNFNRMPDLMMSRANGKSFMVEVKFKTKIQDFNAYQNELYWRYRQMIYKDEFLQSQSEILKKNWHNDRYYLKADSVEEISNMIKSSKKDDLRLPIYFYVVCREHEQLNGEEHVYVHLNYVEKPGFIPIGHSMFQTYKHYRSLEKETHFNEVYSKVLEPILKEVIG